MRKIRRFILTGVVMVFSVSIASYAENYDFPNMSAEELNAVKSIIDEELKANHELSSKETSAVEDTSKAYVEELYGKDNVDWAWFDYTYTKDWSYYTFKSHADIKKQDGGKAQYEVYCELISNGDSYKVIYCKIGEEEILNQRQETITDQRVLKLLGLSGGSTSAEPAETAKAVESTVTVDQGETQEAETQPAEDVKIAARGDKGEAVLEVQQLLTRLGYLTGTPDGAFGGGTEAAVIQFQTENGFTADGIVTQSVLNTMKTAAANAPEPEEVISISAIDLYNEFDNNAIGAADKYKGKTVQVTGTIGSIDTDILGTPYVRLNADEWGWTDVQCFFSNDDKSTLATLSTGQTVTIKGTCGEMSLMSVSVKKCSIVG